MKKFLDTDHPFFRPLWIRVLIVAVCLGWGLLELVTGAPLWAAVFLALGAYAAWAFFVEPRPKDPPQP